MFSDDYAYARKSASRFVFESLTTRFRCGYVLFKKALDAIRMITRQDPEDFIDTMVQLCADAGVAVVFVQEIKKVPWHGATRWLSASKAMILLNLRGKSEDQFWFSFL